VGADGGVYTGGVGRDLCLFEAGDGAATVADLAPGAVRRPAFGAARASGGPGDPDAPARVPPGGLNRAFTGRRQAAASGPDAPGRADGEDPCR
jgi:hypothetical protein